MQWLTAGFKNVFGNERGGIGIAVLAGVLCIAGCLHVAAYWLRRESETVQRQLVQQQVHFAVQALAKADFNENGFTDNAVKMPEQKLYPGGYTLKAAVQKTDGQNGIIRYELTASAADESLVLQQLKITLPRQLTELAQKYTLAAGKSVQGADNLPEGIEYAEQAGNILDCLDIKSFASFKEMDFPAKSSLEEYGLAGALYYDDGHYSKSLASSSKNIKGRGCLAAMMSIFVADGTKMPDHCIIISDGQIEIGKNAVLGNALLLSKYDITVKSGACVSGIAFCDGKLTVEDGAVFTRNESVLQPFITAWRLKQQ